MAGEVLSGPERRRRWSPEEKAKLVAAMMLPGANVTEMSRRYGISRSLLYSWRRNSLPGSGGKGEASALPELVPIMITDGAELAQQPATALARPRVGAKLVGTIEIALPSGARVTVRGGVEERILRAVLNALRSG